MSFGSNLIALRNASGLSRKELAEMLNIPYTTLRNYETDQREPGHKLLIQLAALFSVSVDDLIGNTVRTHPLLLSEEAMKIARRYDELDEYAKETVAYLVEREIGHASDIRQSLGKHDMEAAGEIIYFPLSLSIQPVSAGTGAYLGPEEMETIFVQQNELTEQASFAVKVAGDSMEPEYCDGDILLVEGADDIRVGEIGVFTLDGDGYVKKRGDGELISLNPEYGPIAMNESIWCNGRVIGKLAPEWIQ